MPELLPKKILGNLRGNEERKRAEGSASDSLSRFPWALYLATNYYSQLHKPPRLGYKAIQPASEPGCMFSQKGVMSPSAPNKLIRYSSLPGSNIGSAT